MNDACNSNGNDLIKKKLPSCRLFKNKIQNDQQLFLVYKHSLPTLTLTLTLNQLHIIPKKHTCTVHIWAL